MGVTADLSQVPLVEREAATLAAMARKEPLIYRGRLTVDDLVGEPDLLELQSNEGYAPATSNPARVLKVATKRRKIA